MFLCNVPSLSLSGQNLTHRALALTRIPNAAFRDRTPSGKALAFVAPTIPMKSMQPTGLSAYCIGLLHRSKAPVYGISQLHWSICCRIAHIIGRFQLFSLFKPKNLQLSSANVWLFTAESLFRVTSVCECLPNHQDFYLVQRFQFLSPQLLPNGERQTTTKIFSSKCPKVFYLN